MLPDVHAKFYDTSLLLDISLERMPFTEQTKVVAPLLKLPLSVQIDPLHLQAGVVRAIQFSLPRVAHRGVLIRKCCT